MNDMRYEVTRKARDNHPGQQKAIVIRWHEGESEIVAIWNPAKLQPKIVVSSLPADIMAKLEAEKNAIIAEETTKGFTF